MRHILVTGAAGFIGFHVAQHLLQQGVSVVGLDNLNDYYDVRLKEARLDVLKKNPAFSFHKIDIADADAMMALFAREKFSEVIHLAAQAGVRHSLTCPHDYVTANITGFLNILEGCRHHPVRHLLFASTSSVYGLNAHMPFAEDDGTDHPVSFYGATKKANEMMAHSYAHLFGVPCSGFRFFTVYGPWGRPDMSVFLFTRAILEGRPIDVFNNGQMQRDFTYVDDIVQGVTGALDHPPQKNPAWDAAHPRSASSAAPYAIYNIGNNQPTRLTDMIDTLEQVIGKKAERRLLPLQAGDVTATYAHVDRLQALCGFAPRTPLRKGLENFVAWYRDFYAV